MTIYALYRKNLVSEKIYTCLKIDFYIFIYLFIIIIFIWKTNYERLEANIYANTIDSSNHKFPHAKLATEDGTELPRASTHAPKHDILSLKVSGHLFEKWCRFVFPKSFLRFRVRVRVRVSFRVRGRVEVRVRVSGNTFKYVFGQTSI